MSHISQDSHISDNAYIGNNVSMYGHCTIEEGVIIEDNCIIGKPSRKQMKILHQVLQNESQTSLSYAAYNSVVSTETIIKRGTQIHHGTVVYSGVTLGEGVICEDTSIVRWDSKVGSFTKLMFGAIVCSYVQIGEYCRIGGFCCNDSVIGNQTSMFGSLVHAYTKYGSGRRDPAPILADKVTIGWGATVVGGVTIKDGSYVAAGCIVTKDVPPGHVVTSLNIQRELPKWPGHLRNEYLSSFPIEDVQ